MPGLESRLMDNPWPAIVNSKERQVWTQVLVPLGQALLAEGPAVTHAAVEVMRAESPDLFTDPQLAQLIQLSTQVNIERVGHMLVKGLDPRTGTSLPEETVVAVQSGVRMQVGLSPLLRLFSLAHELVWAWMFERIVETTNDKRDLATASTLAASWTFAFIDITTTRLAEAYDREREAWFSSALAERAETIAAILDGRERDPVSASTRLRYDLRRHHLGICAWLDDTTASEPQSKISNAIRQLADVLEVQTTLISPLGSHAARAWLTRSRPLTAPELEALDNTEIPTGVQIAVGAPGSNLEGFKRSQHEATEARRLAIALADPQATLTRYETLAVPALATVDQDQAAAFTNRVLGPLAGPDPTTQRIAETLAVYLAEAGNRRRTSQRLIVHANTVTYRVRQAETILGRSLTEDTLDLRVALAILPFLRDTNTPQT